jgi:protein-S-isoprenylcysteine O-methyltransferase Ste14
VFHSDAAPAVGKPHSQIALTVSRSSRSGTSCVLTVQPSPHLNPRALVTARRIVSLRFREVNPNFARTSRSAGGEDDLDLRGLDGAGPSTWIDPAAIDVRDPGPAGVLRFDSVNSNVCFHGTLAEDAEGEAPKPMKALVHRLASYGNKRRSRGFKLFALVGGTLFFLLLVPCLLLVIGAWAARLLPQPSCPETISYGIVSVATLLGLSILVWAAWTQWRSGHGTPAPVAPTERIVTTGPYRFSRNPIQLGGSLYFLGFVTFYGSLTAGIIAFVLTLIGASVYHKFVEEKELLLRFGDDYREYRERTPFLFPGLGCLRMRKKE